MKHLDFPSLIYRALDWPIDILLCFFVNTNLVANSVLRERKYFNEATKSANNIDFLNTMLTAIHARAAAAIGHVSIMMGVTVLLLVRSDKCSMLIWPIVVEIILYVLILLLCLRCVRSMTLNDRIRHKDFNKVYTKELIYRFGVQQLINSGLIVATLGFLGIILSYAYFESHA